MTDTITNPMPGSLAAICRDKMPIHTLSALSEMTATRDRYIHLRDSTPDDNQREWRSGYIAALTQCISTLERAYAK